MQAYLGLERGHMEFLIQALDGDASGTNLLDDNPNHPAALFNMAVLMAEFLDQRPQSRELFQRFLRVAPSSGRHREMAEQYLRDIPDPNAPAPGDGGAS